MDKKNKDFKLSISPSELEDFGEHKQKKGKKTKAKTKKKSKKRSAIGFFARLILILVLFAAFTYAAIVGTYAVFDLFGLYEKGEVVRFEVSETDTVESVSQRLVDNKIIDYPKVFSLFASYQNDHMKFETGTEYQLHRSMSYQEIIAILCRSNEAKTTTVTIPEGLSAYEIALLLEENKVCQADAFIEALNTATFDYEFVKAIDTVPNLEMRVVKLEGYLFPDTYDFYINEAPTQVINKLLRNFNNKFDDDLMERITNAGYTLDEILKIASIVQKEAPNYAEMQKVASVYLNRLKKSSTFPKLQADPTTHYAEKSLKPLGATQEQLDSYNTYVCNGLPAGPITNTGLLAVKAVLAPAKTNYYYFVTTQTTNEFFYASTYEQHKKNCQKAGIEEGKY